MGVWMGNWWGVGGGNGRCGVGEWEGIFLCGRRNFMGNGGFVCVRVRKSRVGENRIFLCGRAESVLVEWVEMPLLMGDVGNFD